MTTYLHSQALEDKLRNYDLAFVDYVFGLRGGAKGGIVEATMSIRDQQFLEDQLLRILSSIKALMEQCKNVPSHIYYDRIYRIDIVDYYSRVLITAKDEETALSYFDTIENMAVLL